jgi:hypothetical protein
LQEQPLIPRDLTEPLLSPFITVYHWFHFFFLGCSLFEEKNDQPVMHSDERR